MGYKTSIAGATHTFDVGQKLIGGGEVVADALLALSRGEQGHLKLIVRDKYNKLHELDMYFDSDPDDGDGLLIRLQKC